MGNRKVGPTVLLQSLLVVGREDGSDDFRGVFRSEGGQIHRGHLSGDAQYRGLPDLEMQVRGAPLDDGIEQLGEVRGGGGGAHDGGWVFT